MKRILLMETTIEQALSYHGTIILSTFINFNSSLKFLHNFSNRGIKSVIHISYFYISGLGFFVTMITGLLIGLVTGGTKEPVDGRYMSEYRLPGKNVFKSKSENGHVDQPLMQRSENGVTTLESLERPRRSEQIQVPLNEINRS